MEVLAFVGKLFVGQRAFGEGDSFILGAFGAVFRLQAIPQILIIAVLVHFILILPMFIKNLIAKKEFKLLGFLGCFFLSVVAFKLLDVYKLFDNFIIFIIAFLLMCFFALCACSCLIKSAKKPGGLTYVPFGPPLVLSALYLMFI